MLRASRTRRTTRSTGRPAREVVAKARSTFARTTRSTGPSARSSSAGASVDSSASSRRRVARRRVATPGCGASHRRSQPSAAADASTSETSKPSSAARAAGLGCAASSSDVAHATAAASGATTKSGIRCVKLARRPHDERCQRKRDRDTRGELRGDQRPSSGTDRNDPGDVGCSGLRGLGTRRRKQRAHAPVVTRTTATTPKTTNAAFPSTRSGTTSWLARRAGVDHVACLTIASRAR